MHVSYRSKERSILIQTNITFLPGVPRLNRLTIDFVFKPTSTDKNTSFFRMIRNVQTLEF